MQTVRHRFKMFEEHRVSKRVPGAAPGTWIELSRTKPVDEIIEEVMLAVGGQIVSCSPPGYHFQWLDRELTTRALIVGVNVIYTVDPHERTVVLPAAPGPADRPPAPAAAGPPDAGVYDPIPFPQ